MGCDSIVHPHAADFLTLEGDPEAVDFRYVTPWDDY